MAITNYVPSDIWGNIYSFTDFRTAYSLSASSKDLREIFLNSLSFLIPLHFHCSPQKFDTNKQTQEEYQFTLLDHHHRLAIARSKYATVIPLSQFTTHFFNPCSIGQNMDQTMLISGDCTGGIGVWDAKTRAFIRKFQSGSAEYIISIAATPDPQYFLSEGDDAGIQVWNLNEKNNIQKMSYGRQMHVSSDGKCLLFCSIIGALECWLFDEIEKKYVQKYKHELDHENYCLELCCLTMDPTGKIAVSGSNKGTLITWDVATGKPLNKIQLLSEQVVNQIHISRDEKWAVIQSSQGDLERLIYWKDLTTKDFEYIDANEPVEKIDWLRIDSTRKRMILGVSCESDFGALYNVVYWDLQENKEIKNECIKWYGNETPLEFTADGQICIAEHEKTGLKVNHIFCDHEKSQIYDSLKPLRGETNEKFFLSADETMLYGISLSEIHCWNLAPSVQEIKDHVLSVIDREIKNIMNDPNIDSKTVDVPKEYQKLPKYMQEEIKDFLIQKNNEGHFYETKILERLTVYISRL